MREKGATIEDSRPVADISVARMEDENLEIEHRGAKVRYNSSDSRLDADFLLIDNNPSGVTRESEELTNFLQNKIETALKKQKRFEDLPEPIEQHKLQQGDQEVLISNHFRPLSEEELALFQKWFENINNLTPEQFNHIQNIFLLDKVRKHPQGDDNVNGEYHSEIGGLVLLPPAFREMEYRTGKVPHLLGISTHEYYHQFNHNSLGNDLSREFFEMGEWRYHGDGQTTKGKNAMTPRNPDLVEAEYGKHSSTEEFCEAAVKAMYNSGEFISEEKLNFIRENFLTPSPDQKVVGESSITTLDSLVKPEFSKDFTFTVIRTKLPMDYDYMLS